MWYRALISIERFLKKIVSMMATGRYRGVRKIVNNGEECPNSYYCTEFKERREGKVDCWLIHSIKSLQRQSVYCLDFPLLFLINSFFFFFFFLFLICFICSLCRVSDNIQNENSSAVGARVASVR